MSISEKETFNNLQNQENAVLLKKMRQIKKLTRKQAFGQLSDGISLYSAQLITNKLYHFYAVYSWLQIIVGPLPTIVLAYGLFNSLLKDSEQETAPELVNEAKNVGKMVVTKVV